MMRFASLKASLLTVAAAVATLATAQNGTIPKQPHSIFLSPNQDLAFGITIPADSPTDILFTLVGQRSQSWVAVGFGSDSMPGSLMLILHHNAKADGVTLSPRIATGHVEPAPYPELQVEKLDGTGYEDNRMVYKGRCRNCRTWPGAANGGIDFTKVDQKMIYAVGPGGSIVGDGIDAPITYHSEYGAFTMDFKSATAAAGLTVTAPVLDKFTADDSEGAKLLGTSGAGKRVWATLFHAIFMVGTFIGLLPMGLVIIRVGEWARWHAVNQTFAMILVIIAFGLGIKISTLYRRSMNFRDPHQIIGILVLVFMLVQFFLGVFHHRIYKKTKAPTKLAMPHVWLGRLVMILGVVNAFLGFHLAMNPRYMVILGGLVIAIVPLMGCILMGKAFLRRRKERRAAAPPEEERGYNAQPWVNAPPAYSAHAGSGHHRGIGLADMSGRRGDSQPDLGSQQYPRPIV